MCARIERSRLDGAKQLLRAMASEECRQHIIESIFAKGRLVGAKRVYE